MNEGYSIQCPVIHGYSQVLQAPFASIPDDPCWSVMLDEPFRNQLIVNRTESSYSRHAAGLFYRRYECGHRQWRQITPSNLTRADDWDSV